MKWQSNLQFSNLQQISKKMEAQLDNAFQLVVQPNNEAIKQGELMLQNLKKISQYPLALINYINNPAVNQNRKLNASIELKLWCQFYKDLQQFQRSYYSDIIDDIKKGILLIYLTFPLKISKTLREGIISLADVLFPQYWGDLLSNLLLYANQEPGATAAILKIIQSISNKYHRESRSDPLYEQIILVCNELHDYLMGLTVNMLERVQRNPNNINQVEILQILMKIFYNLNYQDLHPKYQDNLHNWMNILKQIMNIQNTNQSTFKCKGAALQAILLYASKYKEDVEEPIKGFCQQIWQLCSTASQDSQYDQIVFNCLKFFKSLMLWPQMKGFFIQNMDNVFQNLILPNIGINSTLVNLFEEQIDLFIDYYFRNTQLQTRRAAALDLLRVICRHYQCFSPFLQRQLQNFQNQAGNIKSLCAILNLTIDGSSKGFRDVDGCTQLFVREQIIAYTYQNIAKKSLFQIYDWMTKNNSLLIESNYDKIHITILIRFLFYFRIYFPKQQLTSIVQFLTAIKTENKSLKKVIYLTINGFLLMKHGDFNYFKNLVPYFTGQSLKAVAESIFRVIYQGTTCEQALVQSLTKMFYNLTRALAESNSQFFEYSNEIIIQMLKRTIIYDFATVQFLFEGIGYLAYWLIRTKSNIKKLQQEMMSYFKVALDNKSDLLNFCLQILAIYLQLQPETNSQYKNIYDSLLMQQNWKEQNQSLMSSYIQFLISYIAKFKERLLHDKGSIEIILSRIIQIDHIQLFYRFMQAIMLNTTLQEFYGSGYLALVLQGAQVVSKTIQGRKSSLIFICKLTLNYDIAQLLQLMNQSSPFYYGQLIEANFDILKTLSQRVNRKYLFHSICRAIKINYFRDIQLLTIIFNNLIVNTAEKFNFKNVSAHLNEHEAKEKKESTYKKLIVFRQFQAQEKQITSDEEQELVATFKFVNANYPDVINFLEPKNRDRLIKLIQKYSKE